MRLLNADGSPSELSGNGLRCLAALVARDAATCRRAAVVGRHRRRPQDARPAARSTATRYTFRAAIGRADRHPRGHDSRAGRDGSRASTLGMGNPQCVVLGPLPDAERFNRLGPALATHAHVSGRHQRRVRAGRGARPRPHPDLGTRRRSDHVVRHRLVRVGRGRCRARRRRARRRVIAPGGTQRVEWREDGVYLTGWAELVFEGAGWCKRERNERGKIARSSVRPFPRSSVLIPFLRNRRLSSQSDDSLASRRLRCRGLLQQSDHLGDPLFDADQGGLGARIVFRLHRCARFLHVVVHRCEELLRLAKGAARHAGLAGGGDQAGWLRR